MLDKGCKLTSFNNLRGCIICGHGIDFMHAVFQVYFYVICKVLCCQDEIGLTLDLLLVCCQSEQYNGRGKTKTHDKNQCHIPVSRRCLPIMIPYVFIQLW